jgi:hypothetical protein
MSAQDRNVTRHVSQLLGAGDGVKGRSRRLPVLWLPARCSRSLAQRRGEP